MIYGNLCEAITNDMIKRGNAMTTPHIIEVIQAISKADERGDPASIFSLLSERLVWDSVAAILGDPEYHYLYGPTLLQGIRVAFPHLEDRAAVWKTLHCTNALI